MVYIPPSDLSNPNIHEERKCPHCGYNLLGLKTQSSCPECGKESVSKTKVKDLPLSRMPESLIRRVALCCASTVLVFPVILFRVFFGENSQINYWLDFAVAIIWIIGSILVTVPVDNPEARKYGLGKNGILRQVARWGSFGAISYVYSLHYNVSFLLIPSIVVVCIGLFCLLMFLSEIADWVRDEKAKRWLEYSAWGTPIFSFLFYLFNPITITGRVALIPLFANLMLLIVIFNAVAGMFMLTSSVIKSVQHARDYQEYQGRRVDKQDSTNFPHPK